MRQNLTNFFAEVATELLFCFAFFEYFVFYQYSSPQYLASTLSIFALPTGFAVWISTG